MKIFGNFPTVNISKLHFLLVIYITKNLIWTLNMIFSICGFFICFASSDSRFSNCCIFARYCAILRNAYLLSFINLSMCLSVCMLTILSLCLYLLDVDLNGIDAGVQCTSRCRCDKHHTIFWSSSACLRQSLTIHTSGLDTRCWISFIHRVSTLETHAVSVNLASWLHWQRFGYYICIRCPKHFQHERRAHIL